MPENFLAYINSKIIERTECQKLALAWHQQQETIVFTNGCFDILHRGHLEYLASSADLGTKLIIGLNSDVSVKRLKGESRPVNTYIDRALALASLEMVNMVVQFEEETPENLIRELKPHILVKGGDYTAEQVAGGDFVTQNGGKVVIIPFTQGYSTTNFLNRIQS